MYKECAVCGNEIEEGEEYVSTPYAPHIKGKYEVQKNVKIVYSYRHKSCEIPVEEKEKENALSTT